MAKCNAYLNSSTVPFANTEIIISENTVTVYVIDEDLFDGDALVQAAEQSHSALLQYLNTNSTFHALNTNYTSTTTTSGITSNVAILNQTPTKGTPSRAYIIVVSDSPTNPIQAYYISNRVSALTIASTTTFMPTSIPNIANAVNPLGSSYRSGRDGWFSFANDPATIQFNGNQIQHINFNGTIISHLNYNGTQIM